MRVLLVDDDPIICAVIRRILSRHLDVDVVECATGIAALEALSTERYSLVLLDIGLPEMNGTQVLQVIRESPTLNHLPVIMLTGTGDSDAVYRILDLGVTDYMVKPLRPGELHDRVGTVLSAIRSAGVPTEQSRPTFEPLKLTSDTSVLLIDGDADFRKFFTNTVGSLCTVRTASSGLEVLKQCRADLPYAVFIGSELGLLGGEMLARSLRSNRQLDGIRLIGIQPPRLVLRARRDSPYVIMRSFLPDVFMEGVSSLLQREGPLSGLLATIPDLKLLGIVAAEAALTGFLGTHLVLRSAQRAKSGRVAVSSVLLQVGPEAMPLCIELSTPLRAVPKIAERLAADDIGGSSEPEAVLAPLVSRIAELLAKELECRGLVATADQPIHRQLSIRNGGVAAQSGDEMAATAFEVQGVGISFRLALIAGDTTATRVPVRPASFSGLQVIGDAGA
jgi:CheY-like chemotaxis protein